MIRAQAQFLGATTDREALRFVFRDPRGPVGRDLDARSRRVLARARTLAPRRSGRLLSTLRRETNGQAARGPFHDVVVGRPGITDYLGYVVYGTSPHVIRPVRALALWFSAGGKIVFTTRVLHPGTRPDRFMQRALDAAR